MTAEAPTVRREAPEPWKRNLVFGTIGLTIVLGWLGDALWAGLVKDHPLVLIALNAKPRYLVLTVNSLDPVTYYAFGTFRLLCTKPLVWLVGAWYGRRAVAWAEGRSRRGGQLLRFVERHFGRWGWLAICITSNNVMCLLAGATGFSLTWFMVLAVAGTLVRLWLFSRFGEVFAEPIDAVVSFAADHRMELMALSATVVLVGLYLQHRSGHGQLEELAALEEAMSQPDEPDSEVE